MDEFELYLVRDGLSKTTRSNYTVALKALSKEISEFTEAEINAFLVAKIKEISAAGVNKYVKTVRKYCDFMGYEWGKEVKLLNEKPKRYELLSTKEIEEVINVDPPPDKYGVFFTLLAYTGARPHEIAELKVSDISGEFATIQHTKTGEARRIHLSKQGKKVLKEYLPTLDSELLFATYQGNVPSSTTLNKEFKKRLRVAGIKKRTRMYDFRHSYIHRQVKHNDLFVVQKQVGHKNANTTQQYVHPDDDDLIRMSERDPLFKDNLTPRKKLEQVVEYIDRYGLDNEGDLEVETTKKNDEYRLIVRVK